MEPDSASSRSPHGGALEGVRVLDISTFLAGPYCAALLGDFGADVIKIELPRVGDPLRKLGRVYEGSSFYWRTIARNKRTITLDVRKARGRDLFLKMVRQADVVVENFTPGTMSSWGLGYEQLTEVKPGIVLVSISGFGQTGPYRNRTAVARVGMAFGGISDLTGEDGGPPLLPGVAGLADYLCGIYGAFGTLVALHHRDRTGEGQQVDLALFEPVFHMLEDNVELFDKLGYLKRRLGAANPNAAPHTHVKASDGRWVAYACSNDALYWRLCDAMGRPDLRDEPRFVDNERRVENRKVLEGIVADWAVTLSSRELLEILAGCDVPAALIYNMEDAFNDEHYRAREAIIRVRTDDIGEMAMRGVIPKLSRTPGEVTRAGGVIGRDNADVYGSLLGLGDVELAALREDGVV